MPCPDDPILTLHYTRPEIAFEMAPQSMLKSCAPPLFAVAWILAEADRPEGRYVLLAGPIWDDDGNSKPGRHVLEQFGNGGINLLTSNGACFGKWDPDNAFNEFFPENVGGRPTTYDKELVRDLGLDLIRRAERAFGGRKNFLRALDATGHKDSEQDPIMIPLLKEARDRT